MHDVVAPAEFLIEEYKKLKDEQHARIGVRDNLIYVTLASLAAVVAATFKADFRDVLLLLPPVCFVLGWTYLVNDQKVTAIGRHLRLVLIPQIQEALGAQAPILSWETQHRTDLRRRTRKLGQLVVDLLTFCVSGVTAILMYWAHGAHSPVPVAISFVELILTSFLGYQIVIHSYRSLVDAHTGRGAGAPSTNRSVGLD
jgi:hypothetical protein